MTPIEELENMPHEELKKRTPEHDHRFNGKEGYATHDNSIFVVLICDYKMDDGAWCGERCILEGKLIKANFLCRGGCAYYSVYTGGENYWLITAFENGISDVQVIRGVPLVRG